MKRTTVLMVCILLSITAMAKDIAITKTNPMPPFTIDMNVKTDFSITASTSDGSTLDYKWLLDGQKQNSATSTYAYTPLLGSIGYHQIKVIVTSSKGATGFYEWDFEVMAAQKLQLTLLVEGKGTIEPGRNINVSIGSNQVIKTLPATGYHLHKLLIDNKDVGNSLTYTLKDISQDHHIKAIFEKVDQDNFFISIESSEGGFVTPSDDFNLPHNAKQTLAITSNDGYLINDVKINGVSVGSVANYDLSELQQDTTIEVKFEKQSYNISYSVSGEGSLVSSNGFKLNHGDSTSIDFTPQTGSYLKKLSVDGVAINTELSYIVENISKNTSFLVEFERNKIPVKETIGASNINDELIGNKENTPSSSGGCQYHETSSMDSCWLMLLIFSALLFIGQKPNHKNSESNEKFLGENKNDK